MIWDRQDWSVTPGKRHWRLKTVAVNATFPFVTCVAKWPRHRAHAEHCDLAYWMYEKWMAMQRFHAQVRAQRMGVTADVMTRDSQVSSGHWERLRDCLAGLARIQMDRCFAEVSHKDCGVGGL